MDKFKTKFGGYDKKEVDAYLHTTTEYHESKVRELEDCIKRLKEENDYLYAKNSEYHRNEGRISGAILKAMQVKTDLETDLKQKIALEEDRLKIFKAKWMEYARGAKGANAGRAVREAEEFIEEFRKKFSQEATHDLDLKEAELTDADRSYLSEQSRLLGLSEQNAVDEKMSAASLLRKGEERGAKDAFGFDED